MIRNQFRIRHIDIVGNTRTLDRVVRREMKVAEGDAFNTAKLRRAGQEPERWHWVYTGTVFRLDHRAVGAIFQVRQHDDLRHASSPILMSSTLRPDSTFLMLWSMRRWAKACVS